MKTSRSQEFFYYNAALPDAPYDFTDTGVLSLEQRKAFLAKYAAHLQRSHDLPAEPQQVVPQAEAETACQALNAPLAAPKLSRRIRFETMDATLQRVGSPWQGWSFYTKKVDCDGEKLIFDGPEVAPTPAAVYTFDGDRRLTAFTFTVNMDSSNKGDISGGILDQTPGRTVELRRGIEDIVKLQFYSNGVVCARLGNACPYHLKNVQLGRYDFDVPVTVTVLLAQDTFKVVLNGRESGPLPVSCPADPDMIFIGSGMFRVGSWTFAPVCLQQGSEEITDFFVPAVMPLAGCGANDPDGEYLGRVELPFQVGTYANRDKAILLDKTFTVDSCPAAALLTVDSLDPGGCVWLNGALVADTDSFETLKIDITNHLKRGENRLRIMVDPRAPEVLFNWHRQKDAYNGWFCEEVTLDLFNTRRVDNLVMLPIDITPDGVRCSVTADIYAPGVLAQAATLYLRKIHPVAEETEHCLGRFIAEPEGEGKLRLDQELTIAADLWSPDAPNLYALRLEIADEFGPADDTIIETGFRTIRQENGDILLNGKKIVLTGALTMQFLPPHDETPTTHISPRTWQIAWQGMMVRRMNGNTLRMHILGYGSNDVRYARIADRLGLMLIWTTRYIDCVEQMALQPQWAAGPGFVRQVAARRNHPSIIMWEGSNEFHPCLADIDRIYDAFVPAVKAVDTSRMLCPVSHLYYAADSYPLPGCGYYNDAGTADQDGKPAAAGRYWSDPLVIRSAHTYSILLGYGTKWDRLRDQCWSGQQELLQSRDHAYIVSEFAVIGRQNPDTPHAQQFFNEYSYEFGDEIASGLQFTRDEWHLSQAYQALAAKVTVQKMRLIGVDGMLWCCLTGGANDAGYLKPPIDCYGYPKYAFYTLREGYAPLYVATDSVDVVKGRGFVLAPVVFGAENGCTYTLTARLIDEAGCTVAAHSWQGIAGERDRLQLSPWQPALDQSGYYGVEFTLDAQAEENEQNMWKK